MNPSASIVVSQSVLLIGAKMGVTPSPPGPNNRTLSDARDAEAISAVLSSSSVVL